MGACNCVQSIFDHDTDETVNMEPPETQDEKIDINGNCFVYHTTTDDTNTYEFCFRKLKTTIPFATIPLDEEKENNDIKWAQYVKLNHTKQNEYTERMTPNGYWYIYNDSTNTDNTDCTTHSFIDNVLKESDLEMILQTLHNFNLCNYKTDMNIILNIHENEYKLIYWNAVDLNKPNSFCIFNETKYNAQISNDINIKKDIFEIYYMRFECNPIIQELQWKWYETDSCTYKLWTYETNQDLYCKLEASYLSNLNSVFDANKVECKFDFCLLRTPKLEQAYDSRVSSNTKENDIKYIFNVEKMSDMHGITYVKFIQCICFNITNKESFKFSIQRIINGKDCLIKQAEDKQLKEINERWEWDGSIKDISECSSDQIKYIIWNHIIPSINNTILNDIKLQLIQYFTDNDFNGNKIKKMKAKKFVFSVRAALNMRKAKSLMEMYQNLMNFDLSMLKLTNT